MFLSAAKAYEELSPGMKDYLDGKVALHSAAEAFDASVTKINKETHLVAEHPVVTVHPENGRKVLYVNPYFTRYINDVPEDESRYILEFLYQHHAIIAGLWPLSHPSPEVEEVLEDEEFQGYRIDFFTLFQNTITPLLSQ